ncbi:MAG TPA: hypothetical protein PK331_17790 [Gordonia sp. (in: high G+C Gram-positive bacteria)]|uniref:hypothetical protein n=1 Tax=unclassified Gordonia (in: high G+C Gram-positive bacteria) TaxID=2657482 RepID=UPI000F9828FE|nr:MULTISPECIES: hypothetical protein [unclassified Gordonia (in: high G+C Gram-positive bacteria)]RUP41589.1 MAG: hypothetical protein EKK60_00805 [Gordonia sp. (in: high G+C Gram-positive bacteria)]HNP56684.1 hypothetical protein [Gordonia sp. (in: high G+C Gram-positive bacteria)]HRC52758.1 hypothetical protein [Gordonia sp. (in: high G+C Gram-positive bacteria)]
MKRRLSVGFAVVAGALAIGAAAAPAASAAPEPTPVLTEGSMNICLFDMSVLSADFKFCF